MKHRNSKVEPLIYMVVDVFVIIAAFTLAYILRVQLDHKPVASTIGALDYIQAFLVITPVWILAFAVLGLYKSSVYNYRLKEWGLLLLGSGIGTMAIISFEYLTMATLFPARLVAVYSFIISFILLVVGREVLRAIRDVRYQFGAGIRRVLVIGDSKATADIISNLADTRKSGYQVVAFAGPRSLVPQHLGICQFRTVEEALERIEKLHITTIIQTDLYDSEDRNHKILGAAQINHIQYNFIPGEPEFYTGKNTVDVFLGYPMITVSQTPLVGWGAIFKRVFDFITTLVLVVVLSPVYLLLIVLQKILNPGPAFYISKRLSQFSKPIDLFKFRTMGAQYGKKDASFEFEDMGRPDLAEEYRKNRKVENDPRITKFGKFLRDTSLDELPQLFNVLRGDLSLVGPRPILPQEVKFNTARTALLHSVKSGVTGLWQVSGRSELSFEERIELELYYAQNWSFWLDVRIMFKTIGVVIRKTGAK